MWLREVFGVRVYWEKFQGGEVLCVWDALVIERYGDCCMIEERLWTEWERMRPYVKIWRV